MKQKILFPNKFKRVGWFILIPALIMGVLHNLITIEINIPVFAIYADKIVGETQCFTLFETDIVKTLIGVLLIVGGLLVAFSREKNEDEYISSLRLNSLLWAVLVNYLILLFMFLFVYGLGFLHVIIYNTFTVLVIFIAKFNYSLYRNSKLNPNEE